MESVLIPNIIHKEMYYWNWISNISNNLSIIKNVSISTSRYLCIDKEIFPKDYSNRTKNLNRQIFLTDSILDIFVLEI